MGAVRFAGAMVLANAIALAACSGSSITRVEDAPEAGSPQDTSDADPGNPGNPPDENDAGVGPQPGNDASLPQMDAAPTADAGQADSRQDGGVTCVAGGTLEIEPNNQAATATSFAGSACGEISPASESDFLTYTLKDTTTSQLIQYKGNITIKFAINGQTVTWGNGMTPPLPFVKGMPYVLEVKSADGNIADYQIALTET